MFGNLINSAKNFIGSTAKNVGSAVSGFAQNVGKQASYLPQLAQNYIAPKPVAQATPYAQQVLANAQNKPFTSPAPTSSVPPYPTNTTTTTTSNKYGVSTPSYRPPTPTQAGVPSMEEAAKRYDPFQKYSEIVGPLEQGLTDYISSRRPYNDVYQEQLTAQGIPQKNTVLSGLEQNLLEQQQNLKTIPQEDIERRREMGNMTEAAARRIKAMGEKPFIENISDINGSISNAQVGYDRAVSLARDFATNYQNETEQGVSSRRTALDVATQHYGALANSMAQGLTGFSADRQAMLDNYNAMVANGYQLSQQQASQATTLKQQQDEHVATMKIMSNIEQDAKRGVLLRDIMARYQAQGIPADSILSIYNGASMYGPAKENANQLMSLYGVGKGRYDVPLGAQI